jgi:tRNA-Thr(GGU) m(6)t(6)A37 methyltransferase TsaA
MKTLVIHPIGIVHTPYHDRYDTPRQSVRTGLANDLGVKEETVIGTVELFAHQNFEQAVDDLSGFDYIWIIFWFNKNEEWKPKVLPPRGRMKRGVFATRSPYRPNPIGISLCKLIDVNGRFIRVENPDMLDETPVLDIKPYLPDIEAIPDAKYGWIEEIEKEGIQFGVEVSEYARQQIAWFQQHNAGDFIEQIIQVLSFDPFPHPYRRIEERGKNQFIIARKSWRVVFSIYDSTVLIEEILSGYSADVLNSKEPLHDRDLHIQFHLRWTKNEK